MIGGQFIHSIKDLIGESKEKKKVELPKEDEQPHIPTKQEEKKQINTVPKIRDSSPSILNDTVAFDCVLVEGKRDQDIALPHTEMQQQKKAEDLGESLLVRPILNTTQTTISHASQTPSFKSQSQIIDGKALSTKIREQLAKQAEKFEKKNKRKVGLAVVIIGDDPASHVYVKNKIKACEEIGIKSYVVKRDINTTQDQLVEIIQTLNESDEVDGIITQLPLPRHLNEAEILELIDSRKDVDGFHVENAGKLFTGQDSLRPCTPAGIIELIKSTKKRLEGKHAVIIGRSNIVGKPIAMMLLEENCTVTICHSRTKNLARHTKRADILVAAIGKKEFVTGDMIKNGAIVIDVGINRHEGKLYGDVNFEQASKVASHITPVPGGVGPMTITMLMANSIKAASK